MKYCCDDLKAAIADDIVQPWFDVGDNKRPTRFTLTNGLVVCYCPWCGTKLPTDEREKGVV